MHKTMSMKQLAANRRNALKSTGPRTANGRAVSKMNAVKHGILSKEVVVRGLHIRENPREFAALHARFVESLQPVGPVEEMLLDQIVTAHWRLRRALTAVSGEIALSVDEGAWKRSRPNPQLQALMWDTLGDPVHSMRQSALGNRFMENQLKAARAAVEKEGELSEATIQSVVFHGKPYSLTESLEKLRSRLQQNPEGLEPAALRAQHKVQALAYLDRELRWIAWQREECEKRERGMEDSKQAAARLPSADTLEKILRYETKLERQMYRAMNQLERLQRMRQGETIPAPFTMEIAERS